MDTAKYTLARKGMVDTQIATSGVTDPRLLTAFRRVPRELFVPADRRELAYSDAHHPLGNGRFLSPPAVFAKLLQLARIAPSDRALDCWPGTGYSSAIIAGLVRDIVVIEPDAALAEVCRANLEALGIANAQVVCAAPQGTDHKQFDVILVEGAIAEVTQDLLDKLAMGGRLVCLLRRGPVGVATVHELTVHGLITQTSFNANLPSVGLAPESESFVF